MCLPRARPLSCPTLTVSRRLTPLPLPECESACAILLTRLPPNITPRRGCLARTVRMEPISRGHTLMVHRKPPAHARRVAGPNSCDQLATLPPKFPDLVIYSSISPPFYGSGAGAARVDGTRWGICAFSAGADASVYSWVPPKPACARGSRYKRVLRARGGVLVLSDAGCASGR